MKYFLYRYKVDETTQSSLQGEELPVPFLAGDSLNASDGDMFVVYLPTSLTLLGVYELRGETFVRKTKGGDKTLRDYYAKLSFVQDIGPHTSRLFKKLSREISAEDFQQIQITLLG